MINSDGVATIQAAWKDCRAGPFNVTSTRPAEHNRVFRVLIYGC
jgi:hypothetical protein